MTLVREISMPAAEDGTIRRLVPLALWLHEHRGAGSIWRAGSPNLHGPDDMPKWLRRHEARLTKTGALMRQGRAWRLIEPAFTNELRALLVEEREAAHRKRGKA